MNRKFILCVSAILLICTPLILLMNSLSEELGIDSTVDPFITPVNGQTTDLLLEFDVNIRVYIPQGSVLVDSREVIIIFQEPSALLTSTSSGEGTVFISLNNNLRKIEAVFWKLTTFDKLYVWR